MKTRLYIGGVNVDLFEDVPITVNYSVTDIKDPASRTVSYTKTIELPNTPNNAQIFKQLFVVNKDNTINSFDPNLRVVAFVQNGTSTLIEGYFQLTNIVKLGNDVKYEGVIYSEGKSLFSQMGDSFIVNNADSSKDVDLDTGTTLNYWNYANTEFSKTLIDNFPTSNREGQIIIYDNGDSTISGSTYSLPKECLRLALKFKHIWDRIFTKYDVTYSSTFLNSSFFKRMVYLDMHKSVPNDDLYLYATVKMIPSGTFQDFLFTDPIVKFNTEISDVGNRYSSTTGRYTNTGSTRNFDVYTKVGLQSQIKFLSNYTAVNETVTVTMRAALNANGFTSNLGNVITQTFTINGAYTTGQTITFNLTGLDPLQYENQFYTTVPNLTLNQWVRIDITGTLNTSGSAPLDAFVSILNNSEFTVKPSSRLIQYGDVYPKKGVIANQHKQKDFIVDILKMFNLYVLFDGVNYIIEPRDTFYQLGFEWDWTNKIDRSQAIEIVPVGQLNWKQITFKGAADKDYYSDKYTTDYAEVYGQQDVFNNNEFINEVKTVELKFAPPLSVSTNVAYPKIQHGYKLTNGVSESIDGMPRYGYWGGWVEEGLVNFQLTGGASTLTYTGYPYIGEFDDPNAPTLSVLFGPPKAIYYQTAGILAITNNDLYNTYYNNELNNQISANAKLIRCYVLITPEEINNLKLYDTVIVDGVQCLISKISDYDTNNLQATQVELIQYVQ